MFDSMCCERGMDNMFDYIHNANDIFYFTMTMLFKLLYFNYVLTTSKYISTTLIVSSIGALLIIICFAQIIKKSWRMPLLIIINILITFIIISNLVYYRYFNDIITMTIITQASMISSVKSSVFSLIKPSDILFAIDFFLFFPLYKLGMFNNRGKRLHWNFRLLLLILCISTGIFLSYLGISLLEKDQPKILTTFYDKSYVAQNIGLINYHVIDAVKYIKSGLQSKEPLTDTEKDEIKRWFKENSFNYNKTPKYFGKGKGKNIVVIQVEALQEFVIGKKINGMEITPNLNRLIEKSIYFNNYYCETGFGGTSDAEFLVNTSLFPIKTGSVYMKYPGNDYCSLPKVMKEQGYGTIAMHAYKPGFWNRSVMYPNLGFDEFHNKNDYIHDEIIGMGLSDKSFFKQSIDKLKTLKEPYYAFLITLTSHYPYGDKITDSNFNTGEWEGTFLGNYIKAIHYADEALGCFINTLNEEGLMNNIVLAIYGDHYAVTKDKKDDLAKFLNIENMSDFMWVKLQKVPLIIHLPNDEGAGIRKITSGGIDFMPTILNIMGVDESRMPLMGRDLLNSEEGIAIMRNGYFVDDKYLCLTSDGLAFHVETGESYDISNLKDKLESVHKKLEISEKIIEKNLIKEIMDYLLKP